MENIETSEEVAHVLMREVDANNMETRWPRNKQEDRVTMKGRHVGEPSRSEPHGGLDCGEIVFRREMEES